MLLQFGWTGENPDPDPIFRVPDLSGLTNFEETSGADTRNPNNQKPETPDPKNSGNPNAQRLIYIKQNLYNIYIG
jgi:hypothetical protein